MIACDGHNVTELIKAFQSSSKMVPAVIIAKTIKGKGISFMEQSKDWHHNRLTDDLYKSAIDELEVSEARNHGI